MLTIENENFLSTQQDLSKPMSGEMRLMLAVFEEAVVTLSHYKTLPDFKAQFIWREADRWLRSRSKSHPFTFGAICEAFGWEESWMRRKISEALETKRFTAHVFSRKSRLSPRIGSEYTGGFRRTPRKRHRKPLPVSRSTDVREQAAV